MDKVWKLQETYDAVREIVEERPDHVDPNAVKVDGCKYVVDGAPSCIVGVFLVDKVGVGLERMAQLDTANFSGSSVAMGQMSDFAPEITNRLESSALAFLVALQKEQDNGETWGAALDTAKDRFFED